VERVEAMGGTKDIREAVEGSIFGSEIMTPLRNAVRLIDGDETDAR